MDPSLRPTVTTHPSRTPPPPLQVFSRFGILNLRDIELFFSRCAEEQSVDFDTFKRLMQASQITHKTH
jgi:hypothetical protein